MYKSEPEKLSAKDIASVKPVSQTVSSQTSLENVRHGYPQAKTNDMILYGGENYAYSFRITFSDEKGRTQIYVNPYMGEIAGMDRYRRKVFQWLYDFHMNLLLKRQRTIIVALSRFLSTFLTLFGFLLLPKHRTFSVNRKMGLRAKLSKSYPIIGVCTSPFLLVIAFTSPYFGFRKEYQSFFESVFAGKAVTPAPETDKYTGDRVSLNSVLATAQEELKGGIPTMMFFPKDNTSVSSVRMYRGGDFERIGSGHIYIHPITGKVVAINLWKDKPAAEKPVRSMHSVHFDTLLGYFFKILWILVNLAVPFLCFTGIYFWVIRNRQKHFLLQ